MHAVDRALRAAFCALPAARGIAVALSGGRDSMGLLHGLVALRHALPGPLCAVHVHHGLSAHADDWADFCRTECAARDVPLAVVAVDVTRRGGESLEAVARAARYRALAGAGAAIVALAHHADDQAETLLLQLLRGAGPHGLAAMPGTRDHGATLFARPLLGVRGAAIAEYAERHGLAWIEDDSNDDLELRRNALRRLVVPALRERFPGFPETVTRAASLQAEAARLLDDLAALDAGPMRRATAGNPLALDLATFRTLHAERPDRARNVLRWFVRQHGLPAPSAERLSAWLRQCAGRTPRHMRQMHAGHALRVADGLLVLQAWPCTPAAPAASPKGAVRTQGSARTNPDVADAADALAAAAIALPPRA